MRVEGGSGANVWEQCPNKLDWGTMSKRDGLGDELVVDGGTDDVRGLAGSGGLEGPVCPVAGEAASSRLDWEANRRRIRGRRR